MSTMENPRLLARGGVRRCGAVQWLTCAGMFALCFALFYALVQRPSSDIAIHAAWASEGSFAAPKSFLNHVAHPMWHGLVALAGLTGLSLELSAALVTALCKLIELVLIDRLMERRLGARLSRNAVTGLALVSTLVSCLLVPGYNPTVYYGVGSPNTWHSPTQLICMGWMILCVCETARCYDDFERRLPVEGDGTTLPWRDAALLGALLLLSLPAKPTFMQTFLPAAALFFLIQWIRHPKNSRFFLRVLLCVLPSAAFMIAQYLYYFVLFDASKGVVVGFTPDKLLDTLRRVLMMQAFPLFTLIALGKRGKRDTLYWITLLMDAVSVLEFLLLGETGYRAMDGNFGWGMMGAALMAWVLTLARWAGCAAEDWRGKKRVRSATVLGGLLLLWHLASGVYYIVYLFTTSSAL